MVNLSKQTISEILTSIKELNEFKSVVIKKLNQKTINDDDINQILSKLDFIESNTEYIIDLLGG